MEKRKISIEELIHIHEALDKTIIQLIEIMTEENETGDTLKCLLTNQKIDIEIKIKIK